MSNIINICQLYHLGDNIINFIFFNKIKEYIEKNDITINYYCYGKYHKNLIEFKCSNNINIRELDPNILSENFGKNVTINNMYHLWQATINIKPKCKSIEEILCTMFNLFLKHHNIPIIVDAFEYQDDDLIHRYSLLEDSYKKVDILLINSTPLSKQYVYNKCLWDDFIISLSKKYKVAITEMVNNSNENIVCLDNFSVKQIAAVALGVKIIIAINTGPSIPLYNTDILNNVDVIYLFGGGRRFRTRKIKEVSNLNELDFLL